MRRSPELEKLGDRIQQAYRDADASFLEGLAAPEAIIIGTDPTEWSESPQETADAVKADLASSLEYTVQERRAFEDGDVGWMVTRGAFRSEHESVSTRSSSIFHRKDGDWQLVHLHVSIGVPSREMFNPMLQPSD